MGGVGIHFELEGVILNNRPLLMLLEYLRHLYHTVSDIKTCTTINETYNIFYLDLNLSSLRDAYTLLLS